VLPAAIHLGHPEIDITDEIRVKKVILRERPFAVINAAAYTDVDGCEENQDLAREVNGRAPGYIAAACSEAGALLVHYSTDYVFDGTKRDYREDDDPNP